MSITKIRRRLAAVVAAGAAIAALVPSPANATTVCNATGLVATPGSMQVLLEAHASDPDASTMYIACGIVQNGRTVAHISAIGSKAAAAADVFTIALAPYSICREYRITYTNRPPAVFDGCP
ncbi:MAG TPA: hypothetical protein VG318_04985 [Actinomycetota bacterium]|nr:hypothetical protein [Actinomycetota bacterium]